MSIQEHLDKIKGEGGFLGAIDKTTILYLCILAGVGVCCFALGRLSVNSVNNSNGNIIITEDPSLSQPESNTLGASASKAPTLNVHSDLAPINTGTQAKNYVASKNGKLYYPAGCSGAKRIAAKNEIWFATASEAENSGLTPSPSCH